MYKEKLLNQLIESYICDNISDENFLRLFKKVEQITEGKALDLLLEGVFSSTVSFLKEPLKTTLASKAFKYGKKITGVQLFSKIGRQLKIQQNIMKKNPKGSILWKNAKNKIRNLQIKRAALVGSQVAVTGSTAYGLKKLSTRGYNQKEIKNANNRNRY